MNTTEFWQVIPMFNERYMASNEGRVFDLKKWKVVNQVKMYRGYLQVGLSDSGKSTTRFVQRLVLMAFAGLPPKKNSVAMHDDDNPENNHISNLQWGDQSINTKQAYDKGRKKVVFIPAKGKFGKYSKSAKSVIMLDCITGSEIKRYDSIVEANREMGIPAGSISHCCRGRIQSVNGFKWKYAS